jgi:hypothetical protein
MRLGYHREVRLRRSVETVNCGRMIANDKSVVTLLARARRRVDNRRSRYSAALYDGRWSLASMASR